MNISKAMAKMIAARSVMVLDEPFIGSLALNLKLVEDPRCKTAWVDGRSLGFNPRWIETLTADQIKALVFHETMHPALGHNWRRDGRDPKKWNIAADKTINHEAREAGYILPPDGHYAEGDEIGKSAEWIYGHAEEQKPEPEPEPEDEESEDEESDEDDEESEPGEDESEDEGDETGEGEGDSDESGDGDSDGEPGDGDGEGDGEPGDPLGELRDAPQGADAEGDEAPSEQDWKEKVQAAASYAKAMGKFPAGMARLVEDAMRTRQDVRSLLLRFFQDRANSDYRWTRPNARYAALGMYLPALHDTALGEVAIMVDTSGSMDDVALAKARGIVEQVIAECSPARVSMYYADAAVQHVDYFERGEALEWPGADTHIGGGGTDFRPALAAIERDETPVCVVCITDLYGMFPDAAPGLPVLWLSTNSPNVTAPFGETVYVGD